MGLWEVPGNAAWPLAFLLKFHAGFWLLLDSFWIACGNPGTMTAFLPLSQSPSLDLCGSFPMKEKKNTTNPCSFQSWAGPFTCFIDLLLVLLICLPDTPNYSFSAPKDSHSLNQPITLLPASGSGHWFFLFPFPFMMYMAPCCFGTFFLNECILLDLPYQHLSFVGVAAFAAVQSQSQLCILASS